ncbi:hypothetical protein F4778DRAFT_783016 [Xylariomycetidae sp. FL2044]|nr:hypothetical protein F4778DRAFT_783016 [Xylariomycetidae sp. FL2044]
MSSPVPTTASCPDPVAYLNDERFHQKFTIPPGPGRPEPFHVTYSDIGYRNAAEPSRERVVLVCAPLVASRLFPIAKAALARRHRMRLLTPDRPGFGGTTDVAPAHRVRAWLEMVPALLRHLDIEHVSAVLAYSGGTLYALNTLLYLRHLLDPDRPYVALCAPWVHPAQSRAPLMGLANALPAPVVGAFGGVARFVNQRIVPVAGFSSAVVAGSLPDALGRSRGGGGGGGGGGDNKFLADGVDPADVAFEESLREAVAKRVFAESTTGLGADAVLLLKRDGAARGNWGPWGEHDRFVELLADQEEERSRRRRRAGADEGRNGATTTAAELRVEVFFAEADHMIGTGAGPKYFDECWAADRRGDKIRYSSVVVPKSDHDGLLDMRYGVLHAVFEAIAGHDGRE